MQKRKFIKLSSKSYQIINREMGRAIHDFHMIQNGDKIMVAVSGGKDSLCLLHMLISFQRKAPVNFELLAVNLDQGQPRFPSEILPNLFEEWKTPYHIEYRDTYSIVVDKVAEGKTYCSLCSRLRRGILYDLAVKLGCNKLALGHHQDDLIETFLLNTFFSGQLATMSPSYLSNKGIRVLRPLYSVEENVIKQFVEAQKWPIIPCNLCGSQDGLKREMIKNWLHNLQSTNPNIKSSIFNSLRNPDLDSLLKQELWSEKNRKS